MGKEVRYPIKNVQSILLILVCKRFGNFDRKKKRMIARRNMVDGVVEQFDKLRVVNVDFAPEPKNVVNSGLNICAFSQKIV